MHRLNRLVFVRSSEQSQERLESALVGAVKSRPQVERFRRLGLGHHKFCPNTCFQGCVCAN